jgi:tetratricopeptide (TPR) repeat protein
MNQPFTCEKGHRWELASGPADVTLDGAPPCPSCGEPGRAIQATSADTTPTAPTSLSAVHVPGYEILRELGRGGMGVVYLARQVNLNRLVALKMVLSGAHAGERERVRFQAEAGSVAKLRHPNIVQIHEIGEVDGRPFFSLEYVDGGSVADKLTGTPIPARDAASLMIPIARATQAAHDAGIVHRDLKPANVLLAGRTDAKKPMGPAGPLLEATPKLTDFGLAKSLDSTDGPTQTGAVLGTPSYMAPEQAQGHSRNIGPAVDVYALGAILYELLTGRPPFRAETPLDTIMQVVTQEPVPPRQLQPKCPRDLETIALKCLQKEPRKRYGTAGEVADDLQRFLDGEPIRARPVGPLGRAWRWAKRNKAVAALVAALFLVLIAALVVTSALLVRANREHTRAVAQEARAKANLLKAIEAVDRMMTRVADERLAHLPQFEDERRRILEDAVTFYNEFLNQESDDPVLRHETARACTRLGKVFQGLGRAPQAIEAFTRAVQLQELLLAQNSSDPGLRNELAETLRQQGIAHRMLGQLDQAKKVYDRDRDLALELAREIPDEPKYAESLAESLRELAFLRFQERNVNEADGYFFQSAREWDKLAEARSGEFHYAMCQARAYHDLAFFHHTFGRVQLAETESRQALGLFEKLALQEPKRLKEIAPSLAQCRLTLAAVLAETNRAAQVDSLLKPALAVFERLVQDYPLSPLYRLQLAQALHTSAVRQQADGHLEAAETDLERAVTLFSKLNEEHPETIHHGIYLRRSFADLSRLHVRQGKTAQAVADLEKAVEQTERQAREQTRTLSTNSLTGYLAHFDLVDLLRQLTVLLIQEHLYVEAVRRLDSGIALIREHPHAHQPAYVDMVGTLQLWRGLASAHAGNHRAAAADAAAALVGATAAGQRTLPDTKYNLACVYSLAATAARADSGLEAKARDHAAAEYLQHAAALIQEINAKNYFKPPFQQKHFWEDTDLEALRADPEFRRWLDQNLPPPKTGK